jgi:hypothetical protein
MDIEIKTNSTKMEVPYRPSIQYGKENLLGEVPNMSDHKQDRPQQFSVGDEVYFTAFMKETPDLLYVCKGKVTKVPDGKDVKAYRILVTQVADRRIGGKPSDEQKALLGRAINKKQRELHKELGPIMLPKCWFN